MCKLQTQDVNFLLIHSCTQGSGTTVHLNLFFLLVFVIFLRMFSLRFLLAVCYPNPYGFDSQTEKYPQLIPTTSTSSTKALERWEDKLVRLLTASYMKFKDEFGKSHITQQSIRSNFWFHFPLVSPSGL